MKPEKERKILMIRRARSEDCPQLYDLLLEIFQDMELTVLEKVPPAELRRIVVKSMQEDPYRYSYRNGLVFEAEGEIIGCAFGYPGELEPKLSKPLDRKLASFNDGKPLPFYEDAETFPGEWYLDSLVTKRGHRGKGVARRLMEQLPHLARSHGERIIGLNCEQDNHIAKQFYQSVGFRTTSERRLSGHPYHHMQLQA